MSLPIIVRQDAQADITQAHTWYGGVRDRNGNTFVDAMNHAFAVISENPDAFQVVHRNARRYVVDRFPYVVIYFVTATAVGILAVAHGSRHPRIWRKRVP